MPCPNTDEEAEDGVTVPWMVVAGGVLLPHPTLSTARAAADAANAILLMILALW
jgi:hypothetical protein